MSEESLPIQVIYEGKTTRCLPKFDFHENFDIKFSENHWSNTEKPISFFKKVISSFQNVHQTNSYSNAKMSLVTMDTFKGQANEAVAKLCCENSCVLILVPHNLTNKFQPLDVTFNKPVKSFIKEKYRGIY